MCEGRIKEKAPYLLASAEERKERLTGMCHPSTWAASMSREIQIKICQKIIRWTRIGTMRSKGIPNEGQTVPGVKRSKIDKEECDTQNDDYPKVRRGMVKSNRRRTNENSPQEDENRTEVVGGGAWKMFLHQRNGNESTNGKLWPKN